MPTPLKTSKATPAQQNWRDYQFEQEAKTPERLEGAAKFLSGIISITLTILLVGKEKLLADASNVIVGIAALVWLLSLLFALWVIFPFRYPVEPSSAESIEKMHRKVVRNKYRMLLGAACCYFLGLGMLVALFVGRMFGG